MDELNPYAAPPIPADPTDLLLDALYAAGGCWRDGDWIVTTLRSSLPPRCVKTGESAVHHDVVQMTWYPAWAITCLLLGPLFFVPLMFVGRTIHLSVPTGQTWRKRQRKHTLIAGMFFIAAVICGGLACGGAPPGEIQEYTGLAAILLVILSVTWTAIHVRPPLRIHRVTTRFVWLAGAKEPFLTTLPRWPGAGG